MSPVPPHHFQKAKFAVKMQASAEQRQANLSVILILNPCGGYCCRCTQTLSGIGTSTAGTSKIANCALGRATSIFTNRVSTIPPVAESALPATFPCCQMKLTIYLTWQSTTYIVFCPAYL
jgi:hypothetical protein